MSIAQSNTIGVQDAKIHFAELLERVESGEEVTITRHGDAVVRMVPVKRKLTPEERGKAIERIRELSKGLSLGGLKIKDLIAEGRR